LPNPTDYKWELRTTFVDKAQFVDGVRTYDVHARRNLKLEKNDKASVIGLFIVDFWFHVKHGY